PEQVSFVGFDDCESRVLTYPRMTSVRQDTYAMGYRAVKWLIGSLEGGGGTPMKESMGGIFEVNHSTTLAPDVPVQVLPDGRIVVRDRAQQH
ncbi:MAG: substrate-binding domain-containing protein, partial [Planctomycetota bacterium]